MITLATILITQVNLEQFIKNREAFLDFLPQVEHGRVNNKKLKNITTNHVETTLYGISTGSNNGDQTIFSSKSGQLWKWSTGYGSDNDKHINGLDDRIEITKKILRFIRPTIWEQYIVDSNGIEIGQTSSNVRLNRQISGVKIDGMWGTVGFRNGSNALFGFNITPAEDGIIPVKGWGREAAASEVAMGRVFEFEDLKNVNQFRFVRTEKVYAGAEYWQGYKNPNHVSEKNPKLKYYLFPCYKVVLEEEIALDFGIQDPGMYTELYYDANDLSLFGKKVWLKMGIGGKSGKPLAMKLEKVKVFGIKQPSTLNLVPMSTKPKPAKLEVKTMKVGERVLKISLDTKSKILWIDNKPFRCKEWVWK